MSLWLPNGAGETTGDQLATGPNLVTLHAGRVLYVGPTNASDTNNAGLEALRPLATIGQAYTNASDRDMVVLQNAFTQTLTANLAINKAIYWVGGGSNSGVPTASIGLNAAATTMLTFQGGATEARICNVKFPAPSQTNTAPRIIVTAPGQLLFRGCYFETNGFDQVGVIQLAGSGTSVIFESCTFVVTSTDVASRPGSAVWILNTATISSVRMKNCIFDAGTVGFNNTDTSAGVPKKGYAVDLSEGSLVTYEGEGLSFLRGADIAFDSGAATKGFLQASTVTGGAFVRNL